MSSLKGTEKKARFSLKRFQALMLPGIKRWIAVMLIGTFVLVMGVLLLSKKHPVLVILEFLREALSDLTHLVPHSISGVLAISLGALVIVVGLIKMTQDILRAYLPDERESIPDVLYRRRHLERGPKVVVIGGGTGLSNLLKGLKSYTNNLTAIVTVGDDGGSSGRLREELGVLPPGDIRNCITALADEEKLVTELFRYRFQSGQGLEGHSFGNLFLSAVYAITDGDMLEAVKVASKVLNSCGQVLPSSLTKIALVAEFEDGQIVKGESKIPHAKGRIKRVFTEPAQADATPAALEAIANAELIVLGPGSLYTSIIPNLLIDGVADAIKHSHAQKLYICNVMTQRGESQNYSASDHVQALLLHANASGPAVQDFVDAVLVNSQPPSRDLEKELGADAPLPVKYDPEKIVELGVTPEPHPLLSTSEHLHHDPDTLARVIMLWFYRRKGRTKPVRHQRLDTSAAEAVKAGKAIKEDAAPAASAKSADLVATNTVPKRSTRDNK
ncbi:MAG TPA: gluconeogenesis factor YvcK family protein [Oculatellaceae cyanobacterium]